MNNNTKCDLALRIRQLKAALQISFRDIQFISAYHDKILLPYTGDLPQVIQQYIINDALETCYTVKEMQKMQAAHSDTFWNIISDCHTYIGLKTSRSKPIIVFQINYITKSGYESEVTVYECEDCTVFRCRGKPKANHKYTKPIFQSKENRPAI